MSEREVTETQVVPQYFALTKEVLQEVLAHLSKDPVAGLYQKVAQALPVVSTPPTETPTQS